MRLKKGFVTHMLGDEQLMVAAGSAAKLFQGLVRSNETAAFIVDRLKQETTPAQILEDMLRVYEVDPIRAEKDIKAVLDKLLAIGAIEK